VIPRIAHRFWRVGAAGQRVDLRRRQQRGRPDRMGCAAKVSLRMAVGIERKMDLEVLDIAHQTGGRHAPVAETTEFEHATGGRLDRIGVRDDRYASH